ncbi:MAG TPA: hypothetical protein VGS03_07010 [Candidatus Polarisedimenticolia bacterium]|nr:hypothetical protein [Candidatus Polarisedimenticolia bacterium]
MQGKTECPFCGAALVSSEPTWTAAEEEIRLVPLIPIADASWLPRVKAILDGAGVRFLLDDGGPRRRGWSGGGFDPRSGRLVVMVEEGDLARASELLADLKAEAGPDPGDAPPELTAPAWQPSSCPQCREPLESGEDDEPLAYCYHCGASLSPEASDR